MSRAGSRQKQAARTDPGDGMHGQSVIGLDGPDALGLALGQRRRITNDDVELCGTAFQPGEGVGLHRFMTGRSDAGIGRVEFEIAAGRLEGVRGNVEVGHTAGAAPGRVE